MTRLKMSAPFSSEDEIFHDNTTKSAGKTGKDAIHWEKGRGKSFQL